MWPFRTLLDSGATLAFGTDSPVTDIDPIDAVYTAVTRRDADTHEPLEGWLPESASPWPRPCAPTPPAVPPPPSARAS